MLWSRTYLSSGLGPYCLSCCWACSLAPLHKLPSFKENHLTHDDGLSGGSPQVCRGLAPLQQAWLSQSHSSPQNPLTFLQFSSSRCPLLLSYLFCILDQLCNDLLHSVSLFFLGNWTKVLVLRLHITQFLTVLLHCSTLLFTLPST